MSRRLAGIEHRLSATLFERTPHGHRLSEAGAEILNTVEQVEEDLAGLNRKLLGFDAELSGTVHFTCTEALVNSYLAPHFERFSALHPGMDLNIVCTFDHLSLSLREADIAIRFTNSPPEGQVGRQLARAAFAAYVATGTWPDRSNVWLGWQNEAFNRMLISGPYSPARTVYRVDSMLTMLAMARSGLGIAVLPCYLADTDSALERVFEGTIGESAPDIWLLSHPDVRRAARMRVFTEFIGDIIYVDSSLFEGAAPGL